MRVEAAQLREQLQADRRIIVPPHALDFLEAVEAGETDGISCWRSLQVARQADSQIEGQGLVAVGNIESHTLVAVKQGRIVSSREVKDNAEVIQGSHQQIGSNEFLAGMTPSEVDKNLIGYNHSCDPNARVVLFKGFPLSFLVTRQPVEAGQEITADYSVSQKTDTHMMKICRCGADNCRRVVAPAWDWEEESLQQKYGDELAWFIKEAIDERNGLPPAERDALLRHDGTLKMAGFVRIADAEIKDMLREKEKLFDETSGLFRPLLERLYSRSGAGKELKAFKSQLIEAAAYFCVVCPFDNIEEMGIDRTSIFSDESLSYEEKLAALSKQVEKNLDKVIPFAINMDRSFSP